MPEDDRYNRTPYPWVDESDNQNIYGPVGTNMIDYYSSLGLIRKQNIALRTGSFEILHTGNTTASSTDNNTFAFIRV